MSTPALDVSGLQVRLGQRLALRGIDLTLPPGSTLALLGPSGCGKTTLLRALAGLVPLHAGRIAIAGRDVSALAPQQRGIGLMFQHYALFPNLSVRDNIAFGPHAQGWAPGRVRARCDELLDLVGLQELAARTPAQLSGGQRQRVAMARALAPQPALLLMDEPFSAIDESFRVPLRRRFRELQRRLAQTCVLVTHDREEAFELADVVAVMLDGELAHLGPPQALLRDPRREAVARFLGSFNLYGGSGSSGAAALQAAPVASLRLLGDGEQPAVPSLVLEATLQHVEQGLRGRTWLLRGDAGSEWVHWPAEGAVAQPGQRLRCAQPLADLVTLQP